MRHAVPLHRNLPELLCVLFYSFSPFELPATPGESANSWLGRSGSSCHYLPFLASFHLDGSDPGYFLKSSSPPTAILARPYVNTSMAADNSPDYFLLEVIELQAAVKRLSCRAINQGRLLHSYRYLVYTRKRITAHFMQLLLAYQRAPHHHTSTNMW